MSRTAEPPHTTSRILVVDDEDDITVVLKTLLQLSGYDVVIARDGQEALNVLRRDGWQPDLILLDLMMPVMNGWEFRAVQLEDPRISNIPVVLLTGGGNVQEHARRLGVRDALAKPAEVDALLAVIEHYCGPGFDAHAIQS